MKCDWCKKETTIFKMSYFCTDNICPECEERERRHPMYEQAREAERQAVLAGDYNFPGIGKPDDL